MIDALFSYNVKPGMEDRYQAYLDKVFPITEAEEPYVLGYEIFQGADGTYYQHEQYENEDAIWKHMERTAAGQEDFAASTEMLSVTMLGELSDKFRETYGIKVSYTPFRRVAR
ncbi:putative quinol monooxygenase [Nocardia sp. NPDC059239]|uniref:putative quinol monooxygenase n=1 Tax=unclassified Nocardia TaxID=2637762 RepID=UPI00367564B4